MWGRSVRINNGEFAGRFIPTHVGQITCEERAFGLVAVHPHACGADDVLRRKATGEIGSSPRMWGRCQVLMRQLLFVRFIPTHVGQIRFLAFRWDVGAVHPHACGADGGSGHFVICCRGSSPRMWGRLLPFVTVERVFRFIPTHVGQITTAKDTRKV